MKRRKRLDRFGEKKKILVPFEREAAVTDQDFLFRGKLPLSIDIRFFFLETENRV